MSGHVDLSIFSEDCNRRNAYQSDVARDKHSTRGSIREYRRTDDTKAASLAVL